MLSNPGDMLGPWLSSQKQILSFSLSFLLPPHPLPCLWTFQFGGGGFFRFFLILFLSHFSNLMLTSTPALKVLPWLLAVPQRNSAPQLSASAEIFCGAISFHHTE